MKSDIKTARIVGILFLTLMVSYSIGAFVLLDPNLNASDYLIRVSANRTQVIIGVLLELINGIAYIGIAVLMFPIFKQLSESMALGYVGFRVIEFAMQIASDIKSLSLLNISQEYMKAGATDASNFQALGTLLLAERFWANEMVFISYGLGALIFYCLLYKLKLIPRWLSLWGLIGAVLVLANIMLEIFGFSPIGILGIQMGLNEIVLGVWLIVKGFNSSVVANQVS